MTHKTNPIAHRLGVVGNWHSRYFSKRNLGYFLEEDAVIRGTITVKHRRAGIERIDIERNANAIRVFLVTARPGLIIGRGGSGIEDLRKSLNRKVRELRVREKYDPDFIIQLNVEELKKPEISAKIVAENVAVSLEKRMSFRRVIKNALAKVMSYREVRGARIRVAGRLDGAEISRAEHVSEGSIPLITLRSHIDYAEDRAQCTYGIIGIKVWMYKGEILEKDLIL
jgi:small subunit ribosomal protein S3